MREEFHGNWEDLIAIPLPKEIINVKINYTNRFSRFIENFLDIPISYLDIYVKKQENEFSMDIGLWIIPQTIILKLKKSRENNNWGLIEKYSSLLYYGNSDLHLVLNIIKKNKEATFDLNKNTINLKIKKKKEIDKIFSYFHKALNMYFNKFIHRTLKEIVHLTESRYPITEKDFLKKYSYLLEEIKSNIQRKIV